MDISEISNVLIACEFSGVVRNAFRERGVENTYSCDLLPSDDNSSYHYQCDIFDIIHERQWDLMIAHPPCTAVCVSGNRYYAGTKERLAGINFIERLWELPIPHICIENPVGVLSTNSSLGKATQYIQPWEFGEDASKKTGLWLKNLPKLKPTNIIKKDRYSNQTPSGQNKLGPSEDRAKIRSITYKGIAAAMADQWVRNESPVYKTNSCAIQSDLFWTIYNL